MHPNQLSIPFAAYATGAAFRIDLSKRMVASLLDLSNGKPLDTGHYGSHGLLSRGLVERAETDQGKFHQLLRITPAGALVAQLCVMAGLGENIPAHEVAA